MKAFLQRFDLFVRPRTYWVLGLFFALFVLSYAFPLLFAAAKTGLVAFALVFLVDVMAVLLPKTPFTAERITQEKWSLGDENRVRLEITNKTFFAWTVSLIDELPVELQERNFSMKAKAAPGVVEVLEYTARPVRRGQLFFGRIHVFMSTPLGLVARRVSFDTKQHVAVYPSLLQMKKYALYTVNNLAMFYGVKKMRRIGHSYEFEQIKDYVLGDDLRHINWKATARTQTLKTNHFIEERSQPVYCLIDKSRNMNQAFDGMSLLDYAINTSLVISNAAIQKGDKAGLLTFSDKVGTAVRADSGPAALRKIMDNLYYQKYRMSEPDFEFLYNAVGRVVNNRSLLFLFTNFETLSAMDRVLPVLRKINQKHLLVVVLFQNAEIEKYAYEPSQNLREVYNRMIARQMLDEKRQMVSGLLKHGIQSLTCTPKELTINTLNKYIELKAKGLI